MTETTAIYDILCLPILSITQHWPMWLTLLNDGFCQINEMWTTAVIMLLASIIFSCSWLSWWLIEAVVILSKVNRPKRIRCKLAFPYVSLKVHQNNMEKKGWLLQQVGSLTHQFEQHRWISSFYKDIMGMSGYIYLSVRVQGGENQRCRGTVRYSCETDMQVLLNASNCDL